MKKLILSTIALGFAITLQAQDAADRKVQAGLVLGTGINMQKMGTKNFTTNGAGADLTIGANVNFTLRENIGFNTGLEFDFSTTKYKPTGITGPVYYQYDDTRILRKKDASATDNTFQLSERKQKATYVTIPTMVLFRTNYIGYFRYFGKFGLRNSFLLSAKANDKGSNISGIGVSTPGTNNGMKRKNEMLFYKGAVGLTGGVEWNVSGATCLVAEIGYYYGFTPLYYSPKDDNANLFTSGVTNGTGADKYISNAATQSQLSLKISILF
ncbi:MAG: porin family protein [Crocinitomicaceae bacterium]|nr:porin family protein [Crocinitomicaceae bacterium]